MHGGQESSYVPQMKRQRGYKAQRKVAQGFFRLGLVLGGSCSNLHQRPCRHVDFFVLKLGKMWELTRELRYHKAEEEATEDWNEKK